MFESFRMNTLCEWRKMFCELGVHLAFDVDREI